MQYMDSLLVTILILPGPGNSKCYIVGNCACFTSLWTLHLSSKRVSEELKKPFGWETSPVAYYIALKLYMFCIARCA